MTDTEYFLSRVLPWAPIGDPSAWFNVHWFYKKPGYDKPKLSGRACNSVAEMVAAIRYAQGNAYTTEIYFCTSSQRMSIPKVTQGGRGWNEAVRSKANVVHLRAFFIDIDVKDKAYDSPNDAVAALIKFVSEAQLPQPSVIVQSGGGGLHVYWVIDTALEVAKWQPLANALAEATRKFGLTVDTACTVDSARILRIPGTFNKKYDPPRPVTLVGKSKATPDIPFQTMANALHPYMSAMDTFPSNVTPWGNLDEIEAEMALGVTQMMAKPVQLESIKPHCGFIREAIDTGGANMTYPLWNLTTLIATFAEDGHDYAHKMSYRHPSYSQQDTSNFFNLKQSERARGNIGWPKCTTIQAAGCGHCATCPHLAAHKSPLNHGSQAPSVFRENQQLPRGYLWDDYRRVVNLVRLDNGEMAHKVVLPYPMYNGWLQEGRWVLNFTTILEGTGREINVAIPVEDLNGDGLWKILGSYGIGIDLKDRIPTRRFLVSWTQTLQRIKERVVNTQPYGWVHQGNTIDGFCYGGKLWSATEVRQTAILDQTISSQYGPTGDLETWKYASSLVTLQGKPELDALIAMSFGAPLITFTGHEGAVISAYSSQSGIGKTTAVKIACAVWAHPTKALQGLDDTTASIINKIGTLQNLPMFWDEVKTDQEIQNSVNMVFRVSSGKEKSRLNSNITQRDTGSWQTLVAITSNNSILDHVATATKNTTAGIFRVFEYPVPELGKFDIGLSAGQVSRAVAELNYNYGNAGLLYAQWLGANTELVRQRVAKTQDALGNLVKATHNERFWVAAMSCILCGAIFSNELGLTKFDLKGLTDFLLQRFGTMRGQTRTSASDIQASGSLSGMMQQFLAEKRAYHTLVVSRSRIGMTGAAKSDNTTIRNGMAQIKSVQVQVTLDRGLLHISRVQFRRWLVDEGFGPSILNAELENQWGAKEIRGTLGAGTMYASAQEFLYEIDIAKGPAAQFAKGLIDAYT